MIVLKRYFKIFIILLVLIIFYLYVANITLMPKSITLLQGEKLELATIWGINLKKKESKNLNLDTKNIVETLETSSTLTNDKMIEVR